eukprot:TRINITY_DN65591_c0_g1_i1.p3 TRINITY_DN65591_c0_g1~~TRINITY_DN65591_c0_g1_i1.p3  ORF type:complete len:249 (+),score=84.91 TRINITY_DN65591_c0_g1_i1:79-747(+)
MLRQPRVMAGAGLAGFATQLLCHTLDTPPALVCPEASRYLGRFSFLTFQTNVVCTAYFAAAVRALWGGSELGTHLWLRRLFPMVFGLGSFLTLAYYALDHFNPVSTQRRAHYKQNGYPLIGMAAHGEHCFALPLVVLQALNWSGPAPSFREGLPYTAGFMAWYLFMTHANRLVTGAWIYPVIDDVEAKGGAVGRCAFFLGLTGACVALSALGTSLVRPSGKA